MFVPSATKVVNNLVSKLPCDGRQSLPSSEVVVNICGTLNNLVTSSSVAARDVTFFDGLQKLVAIKNSHDSRYGVRKECNYVNLQMYAYTNTNIQSEPKV